MEPLQEPGFGSLGNAATKLPAACLLRVERDGNPLRRFGHVSPHIGKIAPLDAEALHEIACLARACLPPNAPGPTLVVGMAESALLLSWFLAARLGGEIDLRFTTREPRPAVRNGASRGASHTFLEPHSHGPVHSLALPDVPYSRAVIVEDELTTGATLRNLLLTIRGISPRHHVVTLSDKRPEKSRKRLREEMDSLGIELSVLDLSQERDVPRPVPTNGLPLIHNPFSRSAEVLAGTVEDLRRRWHSLRPGCLYAIGECVDVAMALWELLPPDERPVIRHVTRSPWLVDGEVVVSRLDLGFPSSPRHFLYNWTEETAPPRALLVGESSTASVAEHLERFLLSRAVESETVEVPPA